MPAYQDYAVQRSQTETPATSDLLTYFSGNLDTAAMQMTERYRGRSKRMAFNSLLRGTRPVTAKLRRGRRKELSEKHYWDEEEGGGEKKEEVQENPLIHSDVTIVFNHQINQIEAQASEDNVQANEDNEILEKDSNRFHAGDSLTTTVQYLLENKEIQTKINSSEELDELNNIKVSLRFHQPTSSFFSQHSQSHSVINFSENLDSIKISKMKPIILIQPPPKYHLEKLNDFSLIESKLSEHDQKDNDCMEHEWGEFV
jgi:hypothetical protein